MSRFVRKSGIQFALPSGAGFAHDWVETREHVYDFNREAIKDECECGCEDCGGFSLDQLADDEILVSPGVIYRIRKEANDELESPK